jgi:predicted NUDIX family NTP pyrophosphohydrolase
VAYRTIPSSDGEATEVLLGHLGGPFWAKRHEGAWSFPKGLLEDDEDPFAGALREFCEELGFAVPGAPSRSDALDLGVVRSSSKEIQLFAVSAEPNLSAFLPGTFEMEWPPKSGLIVAFPEIDRIAWADLAEASEMLSAGQRPFVERLRSALS